MNAIPIKLPTNRCTVSGFLYESDDPDDLSEDMIEVSLSDGTLVCAGWHEDLKEGPAYLITATEGLSDRISPIRELSAYDAAVRLREVVLNLLPGELFAKTYGTTADVCGNVFA